MNLSLGLTTVGYLQSREQSGARDRYTYMCVAHVYQVYQCIYLGVGAPGGVLVGTPPTTIFGHRKIKNHLTRIWHVPPTCSQG